VIDDAARVTVDGRSLLPESVGAIGVFAPASAPSSAALERGIARLRTAGVQVDVSVSGHEDAGYLAGTDADRLEQFHSLLRAPHLDALFAARGGYGCARLLDGIDWELFLARRLPIVGYSDVTALHLAALKHDHMRNIAGPMVASDFGREVRTDGDVWAFAKMLDSLAQAWGQGGVPDWAMGETVVIRPGTARGMIVPATLSVLVTLIGTPFIPDLSGAVLVLEDVHEPAYKLDRYLTQLRQTGILKELGGLVFGDFRDLDDAEHLPALFTEFAASLNGPVLAGVAFGHRFPSVSLPVGRSCTLVAADDGARLRWGAPE